MGASCPILLIPTIILHCARLSYGVVSSHVLSPTCDGHTSTSWEWLGNPGSRVSTGMGRVQLTVPTVGKTWLTRVPDKNTVVDTSDNTPRHWQKERMSESHQHSTFGVTLSTLSSSISVSLYGSQVALQRHLNSLHRLRVGQLTQCGRKWYVPIRNLST